MTNASRDTAVQFAKTGDPNPTGLPNWPRYSAETDELMNLRLPVQSPSRIREGAARPSSGSAEMKQYCH